MWSSVTRLVQRDITSRIEDWHFQLSFKTATCTVVHFPVFIGSIKWFGLVELIQYRAAAVSNGFSRENFIGCTQPNICCGPCPSLTCTQQRVKRKPSLFCCYQVQGFPTIKMFPAGKKDASDAVEYDGGRSADSIVAWALDKLAENVPAPDTVEVCAAVVVCL